MAKRTINAYVVSEVLPPVLYGLLAFSFVLLIGRIVKLVELVVTRGVPMLQILKLFALIVPTFLEMTVPMALLLGIFLGLGRLSSDQEILALKANGVSPAQILLPIATIGLTVSLITFLLTAVARPAANLALKKELYNIAKSHVGTALREKVFNDDIPKVLIYVDEVIPPGDTFQGVLLVDRRTPDREGIIFGKVAIILADEESNTISLKLIDGTVYERGKNRQGFSQTHFNTYDFRLDLDEAFSLTKKKDRAPKEMSLRRLLRVIRQKQEEGVRPTAEIMELHQRFSFSLAPLVFSLLGLSLVMLPTRSHASRPWGLALCLFWLLIYYALFSLGKPLGEKGLVPEALALWLPNIVLTLMALHFFRKALTESPLSLQTKLEDLSLHWTRKLADYRQRHD